jgi:hypothetical protein
LRGKYGCGVQTSQARRDGADLEDASFLRIDDMNGNRKVALGDPDWLGKVSESFEMMMT